MIPSYRLSLMRDGIQDVALLKVLRRGIDDAGRSIRVGAAALAAAEVELDRLWADNPVQWYVSDHTYQRGRQLLTEAA